MQKNSKYKYKYYQNTHTLQNPHIHTPTHYKTHTYTHTDTLQNKLKQPQYKIHTKWSSHNTIKYPQYKVYMEWMKLMHRNNSKLHSNWSQ